LPQQFNGIAWASLAFQVYPTTLFGYWAWNSLMARYSAAEVSPVALLVPIFAVMFAWLLFGVMATPGQTIGIVFILLGLLTTIFYQRLSQVLTLKGWVR
jgi:O-acetylserine/cysteine efflux transporter